MHNMCNYNAGYGNRYFQIVTDREISVFVSRSQILSYRLAVISDGIENR